MKLEEFKIGEYFYTGSGAWKVIDIGTRTVIAYQVWKRHVGFVKTDPMWDLNNAHVFYPMDWDGCSLEDEWDDSSTSTFKPQAIH